MAARPHTSLQGAIVRPYIVQAAGAVTKGMPVKIGTLETDCLDAAAGDNPFAIALETGIAGATVNVALLAGDCIIPVRVGTAGATAGKFGEVGTTGLIDRTLGGGTTVRYIAGKFLQTGVDGDFVGLVPSNFAGVSS